VQLRSWLLLCVVAAEAEGSGYKNEAQVRAREIMSVKGRGLAKASVLLPASFP
jgi:hypothetical protein